MLCSLWCVSMTHMLSGQRLCREVVVPAGEVWDFGSRLGPMRGADHGRRAE